MSKLLFGFVGLRLAMAVISRSWHVPDETWQSVEISHRIVFGYGYQTWEWQEQIRSYLHPLIFVPGLWVLKVFHLDTQFTVELVPRICQGLVSALGDICIVDFCGRYFGPRTKSFFIPIYILNFFINYCSSRTLVNTMEMSMTNMALSYYPIKDSQMTSKAWAYVGLISASFMVRSTTAIFWLPLVLHHIYDLFKLNKLSCLFSHMIPSALVVLILSCIIDSFFYGTWTFIPWNFFKINIFHNVSSLYGVNPPYWYLTHTFPVTLTLCFVPFFLGIVLNVRQSFLAKNVILSFVLYSCITHKEQRFLLPLLPLMICFSADFLARKKHLWECAISEKGLLILMCLTNIPILLYASLVHQIGVTNVIRNLSYNLKENDSVVFLTPCHSTPFYSHLHRNIELRFLECPPDLANIQGHKDEADEFYKTPVKWLENEFAGGKKKNLPTRVVIYDNFQEKIKTFLENYEMCSNFFHSHFPEGKVGHRILIFCSKNT